MMDDASWWVTLLWVFVCVVAVLGLAYWSVRFVAGRGWPGMTRASLRSGAIRVLARVTVGRDQSLLLVRVGERCFLLGAAASGISRLAEFTPGEAAGWSETAPDTADVSPGAFRESLRNAWKHRSGGDRQ